MKEFQDRRCLKDQKENADFWQWLKQIHDWKKSELSNGFGLKIGRQGIYIIICMYVCIHVGHVFDCFRILTINVGFNNFKPPTNFTKT